MSKEEMNYYKNRIGQMEHFDGELQGEMSCELYDARFECFFEKDCYLRWHPWLNIKDC